MISQTPQARAAKVGDFLHNDIQTVNPTGIGGINYTMVIVDDKTATRFAINLEKRSQASSALKSFAEYVNIQRGSYPKEWRLDGAKDFLPFIIWAKETGESCQVSAPYMHE